MTTSAASTKPTTILRFGPIRFAQEAWSNLSKNYNVKIVESEATGREEFLKELKSGKYKDVDYITRTFESVKQTGLVDKELLTELTKNTQLKAISHNGAGYDQVDAVACGEFNIQLSNVSSAVDDATADTNIYLMIGALRNFGDSQLRIQRGLWPKSKCGGTAIGHDPEHKVLGILGMGGIGRAVRDRAKPFGFSKIIYYNRRQLSAELEGGAELLLK
ncbi:unnamed protein product [Ambrosiozyma monospora]|uniref:Unnamed protein product n=1 Tax=Ambrosiozyma monospora TaxID=43982 RepID=A0ACB5TVM9_AMBMO|nr:unnamed protein product [Ambrosiozyma monospora]